MIAVHPFDDAIALQPSSDDGVFTGATHPAWANMVGPFGGITAATLLHAASLHPRRLGEPVALTVNYAGPLADGAFRIEVVPVRTNRTTQHWTLTLRQGDDVAATASAVFATRRDTWAASELQMPDVRRADQVPVEQLPVPVEWTRRYEMRFVDGGWPDLHAGTELPDSTTRLWLRDTPQRPLDALSLAAMADAFYPRIFRRRQRFVPAGTVSISTFFHAGALALAAQGTRPVLGCARGRRFTGGFFEQGAELWGDAGELLASSHQVVYYKA